MFRTFEKGMLLCGGILQADGSMHPLSLSVVLAFMDEVANEEFRTSPSAPFQYKLLADLAFDCAFLAQGTPKYEREELIERCRKETARLLLTSAASDTYTRRTVEHLRKRARDLETALRR